MNFGMVLETLMLSVTEPDFFCPKNVGNGSMIGQKWGFLNLKKSLVNHFHWICSIMKIYIICCVPALILYLRKIFFLSYRPKWLQPIRLQDFLINHFSRKKLMKQHNSLHVDRNSQKLKVDQTFFVWGWSKMSVTNLVSGLKNWLYLQNKQMELSDFLHAGTN